MTPRPYHCSDITACLSIFDSNVPTYFASQERGDFERFLHEHAVQRAFQVIEVEGQVVACGGLWHCGDGNTSFCWGMVERGRHRQGLGRALAVARLHQAEADPSIQRITLSTSQHTQGFYARFGFETQKVTPDGYAPGIDRWDMVLKLD